MYPVIIKCPACGVMFKLKDKPKSDFRCPKCGHKAPFAQVLAGAGMGKPQMQPSSGGNVTACGESGDKTKIVNMAEKTKIVETGDKTKVVPGLQPHKGGSLTVLFMGVKMGVVKLADSGSFTLGRRSSDSGATVKLAPDMAMSRVHAAMRVVKTPQGIPVYQITTVKSENPVFVNGKPVPKGAACRLKTGDLIKMGNTVMTFKLG